MFGQQASERSHAWSERFWPTKMIPGRGTSSDVWSSGHRPCPGEQALPRRHALLHFALRGLLLFCKPLSPITRACSACAHPHAPAHASVHPRPSWPSNLPGAQAASSPRHPLSLPTASCSASLPEVFVCLCKRISPPPSAVENSPQPSQYRSSAQAAS